MAILDENTVKTFIDEVNENAEVSRRAEAQRRQDIYSDGGKKFLIEQLEREFGSESLNEVRLAPINFLKKIVNKRANLHKSPPAIESQTGLESDQALVDFYREELDYEEKMDKWNRYWTLHSNSVAYVVPRGNEITLNIVPPYLYSVSPNPMDRTRADIWGFSSFLESGRITRRDAVPANGPEGWQRDRPFKPRENNLVDSRERTAGGQREFILWSDEMHVTSDSDGNIIRLNPDMDDTQFINPIGIAPIVNLRKDVDGDTFWATQFQDTVDLSMALMLGFTDLLTVSKHQHFNILTVISEEEPKQLTVGINRAVWLKQREGSPTPQINYVSANSQIGEYQEMLLNLLGLMLSTANMNPKEIAGANSGSRNYSSGFQALIENADILEARKSDMAPMRRAEQEVWEIIKRWHNWMFDGNMLSDRARGLGKFSDDFAVSIQFADVKPMESSEQRIKEVRELLAEGLISKFDAMKILNPDKSDEQIESKLKEIENESTERMERFMGGLDGQKADDKI